MSILKKAKYVGVISSLFCVGSLMAAVGGGNTPHQPGQASSSERSGPSALGAEKQGGPRQGSSSVAPKSPNNRMVANEQTLPTETRTGPDGSKITTFKSPSGGSAEVTLDPRGELSGLDLTGPNGSVLRVNSTGAPGSFDLTDGEGTLLGRINVGPDGTAQFTGELGGQDSATYTVGVEGDTTTFTDTANPSQKFTVRDAEDGTISVTQPNGVISQVAALGTPSDNSMVDALKEQGASSDATKQASAIVTTVSAVSAAMGI